MATEVLRPRDSLAERIREPPCKRSSIYGSYNYVSSSAPPASCPKPAVRKPASFPKKRDPANVPKRSPSAESVAKPKSHPPRRSPSPATVSSGHNQITMEKVVILRRGESLDSKIKSIEEALEKQVSGDVSPSQIRPIGVGSPRVGIVYAGSAFSFSPEPSSLPLPTFPKKKNLSVDVSATRDLIRLLRLEF